MKWPPPWMATIRFCLLSGPDAGENRARLGFGVSADITPMVSMDGRFKAVLSPEQQSYAASAHVRYTF